MLLDCIHFERARPRPCRLPNGHGTSSLHSHRVTRGRRWQVPNKVDQLLRAQDFHSRRQQEARSRMTAEQRAQEEEVDYLRPIVAGAHIERAVEPQTTTDLVWWQMLTLGTGD